MIVVDASVLANAVGDDADDGRLARDTIRAAGEVALPDLADVEVAAVLRKRWLAGAMSDRRFGAAIAHLQAFPFTRWPARLLLARAYELRHNITAYDAMYLALAERLGASLVTADERLARAPGSRCDVELLRLRR